MFKKLKETVFRNREEKPSGRLHSAMVDIQRPPSLQELVSRAIRVETERMRQIPDDPFNWEAEKRADPFTSPYELVHDETVGREVTKAEKAFLDQQRAKFDSYVTEQNKKKREAAKAKRSAPKQDKEVES